MKISAPLLHHLLNFADYRGLDKSHLRSFLPEPGVSLCDPGRYIAAEDYLKVLRSVILELKDKQAGLSFGYYLNLSALGVVHNISLSATRVQQALLLLTDYLEANFPLVKLLSSERAGILQLTLSCSEHAIAQEIAVQKAILDSTYSFIYRELSMMLPTQSFTLLLPYIDASAYIEKLGAPVRTANEHGFLIPLSLSNAPISSRQLDSLETLLPSFLQLVPLEEATGFAHAARNMALHMCAPELPNLHQLSSQFAMSERSFQRRLAEEKTSFRAIINSIKKELARYLHEGKNLKTQDIAYLLGYSESSAFLHAAKKWQQSEA